MRAFRRLCLAVPAALLLASLPVTPAAASGAVVIDNHDSVLPTRAWDLSSHGGNVVLAADAGTGLFGHAYLRRPGSSSLVSLGERASHRRGAPQVRGGIVAIPEEPAPGDELSTVRWCYVDTCPTWQPARAVPASGTYLGSAGETFLSYTPGTLRFTSLPAGTTATAPLTLESPEYASADADATGVLLTDGGDIKYLNRSTGALTEVGFGNKAVLTPDWIVWYAVAVGPGFGETHVNRVNRALVHAGTAAPVERVATLPGAPDFNDIAANGSGVAWLIPNADGSGSNDLWTVAYGGTAALYPRRIDTTGLSDLEGSFVVNDRRAGLPGLYRVPAGGASSALVTVLPVRGAITSAVSVSHGRAAYVNDATAGHPLFLRDVSGPSASAYETTLTGETLGAGWSTALSGPFVAWSRTGTTPTTTRVVYGRVGGPYTTVALPFNDVGKLFVSGRRLLVTGGARSRLIDMATGSVTDLGRVYAAVFGDFLATINYDTGQVLRRNLATNATHIVRGAIAGCSVPCVDEERWRLSAWGNEVFYAFPYTTGTGTYLDAAVWSPTLSRDLGWIFRDGTRPTIWDAVYWDGVLALNREDADVWLYQPSTGGSAYVDGWAEGPLALDSTVVAWRPLDHLRATVQRIDELLPGHVAHSRYTGGIVPAGFATPAAWRPRFFVSHDVKWSLAVKRAGTLVRTIDGASAFGEITPAWDGADSEGAALPQGYYTWELTGTTPEGEPLQTTDGTSSVITGSIYLSRTAPVRPSVTAATLASDVSTTGRFPVSWRGAPAGHTYSVSYSVNGGAFVSWLRNVGATGATFSGATGNTYRFRVVVTDPAGRVSPYAEDYTVVPFDNRTPGAGYAGSWNVASNASMWVGSHHYSAVAGSTYTFRATGRAIHLVGTKGTVFGQFQVSIDGGAWSGLVDTYASSTRLRQVVFSRGGLALGAHTIRVRVFGTRGRPTVSIDGVAFVR